MSIKPNEIIQMERGWNGLLNIDLHCITESGLGRGGFKFILSKQYDSYKGRDCCLWIHGKFINMVGPFKNRVECSIGIEVFPTTPEACDGYNYVCIHTKEFWGRFYNNDANELCCYLLNDMISSFELGDDTWLEGKNEYNRCIKRINLDNDRRYQTSFNHLKSH